MNYIGIADCHGLESFVNENEPNAMTFGMFAIRAAANAQRHAIAYKAEIDQKTHDEICHLMTKERFKDRFEQALILLKERATTIYIPEGYEILWDSIPDRTIDPYYSEEE